MEIFMRNISFSTNKYKLTDRIATILHSPHHMGDSPLPLNFEVQLFRDKKGRRNHSGCGSLTLPTEEVGQRFLNEYGILGLYLDSRTIFFSLSRKPPRTDVVETIRRLPYLDPKAVEKQNTRDSYLRSEFVSIKTLQFGWECRDQVFSIEWEETFAHPSQLFFEPERREIRIKIFNPNETKIVAMRFSQISWTSAHISHSQQPAIFFHLFMPPAFESEDPTAHLFQANNPSSDINPYDQNPRQRCTAISSSHEPFAPYTSLAIRLVCRTLQDLAKFRELCETAHFPATPTDYGYPVEYRGLFSQKVQQTLRDSLKKLPWLVRFQVQSLIQSFAVDFKEMLALLPSIERVFISEGERYTSGLLRHFSGLVKALYSTEDMHEATETVDQCFARSVQEYRKQPGAISQINSENVFDCLHALITPTTIFFEGPYPERSNRVIRSYPDHHDYFLRVSFVDEARLQYRFDREVDGRDFVRKRFGPFLSAEGSLDVAGRPFKFLAYSQSALKVHAVWFVAPFEHELKGRVDASSIIQSLGNFTNLEFDRELIYCPARYGARISQAFTATDASLSVEVDEVFPTHDIERNGWCFTDGVGTMSRQMAKAVSKARAAARRRPGRPKSYAHALQIRFMGSKGMLCVDHKLSGRAVCLRESMIKFEAPSSRELEIAKVFDKPGRYYLNRPLIMILEGLGIKYNVFKYYQDKAVVEAQESVTSLSKAGRLLEAHGLGNSFRLTSVMLNLDKLGIEAPEDDFYQRMMEFAVNHVLRDLKQRARIPIPGAWTLVGVADFHGFLKENEIFVCIIESYMQEPIYLEGDVVISRSPTIHPGDVRVARAIGRPPPGSSFEKEPLPNTVVFSVQGRRPLPSCLGGGDLDGDEYNLIPLNDLPRFKPTRQEPPAKYDKAPRKTLNRHSTMDDVANFVIEYINSDVLGIVATNWLIIADQDAQGIFHRDCLELAKLHSDAVDYPKSGQPVELSAIPRLRFRTRPDWNAPETVNDNSPNYYKSQRAIGRLFREIDLPALKTVKRRSRIQHRRLMKDDDEESLDEHFSSLDLYTDTLYSTVEECVQEFGIDTDANISEDCRDIFGRYVSELRNICASHSLSYSKFTMLTEEEAIIGTIVAKSSQPRHRKDVMAKLRDTTEHLVRGTREELDGDDDISHEEQLSLAWAAWKLSVVKLSHERFGAKSFGWIALGQIFEVIGTIEEAAQRSVSAKSGRRY